MIFSGLVSVTFRPLTFERVIELAVKSSIKSIEWGGDIHVPPGNTQVAKKVRDRCKQSGIEISAYGSYYRAGVSKVHEFDAVLETAAHLETKTIRVWAGNIASRDAAPADRNHVVAELIRCCELASARNIEIATEFHSGTLTDTASSCVAILASVNQKNCRTFWQPPVGMLSVDALAGLRAVMPYLSNIHVFHWWPDHLHRLPLKDGHKDWLTYLKQAVSDHTPRFASLEFIRGDDEQQFQEDARVLHQWLDSLGS